LRKRKEVQQHQHQEQQASIQPLLQQQQQQPSNPLNQFIYALRSSEAQKQYSIRLKMFFNFLDLHGTIEEQAQFFLDNAKNNGVRWTQDSIINFINHHKQRVLRKELAAGTLNNYFMAVKLFCEMNDLTVINWKRISRGLPKAKVAASDRAPTLEEIRKLVEYPDRRIKALVYPMASGGFRLGAWQYLGWKHVIPITNEKGEVIAAKVIIYADEPEEYYTFITPEAYNALKTWMEFRASYGEKITGESWVMRDLWQTSNVKYDNKRGLATNPKRLEMDGIEKILNRALWEQNLRQPLSQGARRHEWKSAHGFRKYFKTRAEQVMKPLNVELLMGHDSGISESYWRPTENEVLQDYLKALDLLTINDNNDNLTLQKQLSELTEQSREENYVIKGKLAEKEKEIEAAAREAEQTKKMLQEIRLQQEIQKAEHEIDQANHENLARFVMGLEKSVIINVYDEKDGTQGLLELGAKLRKEREAREKKHELWHSRKRNKKVAKTI
jgi:hypothetical protein